MKNKYYNKNENKNVHDVKFMRKGGGFIKAKAEYNPHNGTDDVFMIAVECHNPNNFDVYFIEDERYIEKPVRYKVKAGETVVLPHQRLIPWTEDGRPFNVTFNYGDNKGKGITQADQSVKV